MSAYQTNLLGPLTLTRLILPLLTPFPSSASQTNTLPVVINISSICGSITPARGLPKEEDPVNPTFVNASYVLSKMALNAMGVLVGRQLKGEVVIGSIHPAYVATDMGAATNPENMCSMPMISVEESAKGWCVRSSRSSSSPVPTRSSSPLLSPTRSINGLTHLTKPEDTGKFFSWQGDEIDW
jgi:NAD(P)-dependent dehydrogenase (short-subunit alcohol dehydrogenase family)